MTSDEKAALVAREDVKRRVGLQSVAVNGIWLRKRGRLGIEVLAEVDGRWRLVMEETWPGDGQGQISHIVEPGGIELAPLDDVTEKA